MQPISGDFLYPDEGSLYIPAEISIHNGWGQSVSAHVVGPDKKPLPNRMQITFFSYLEDKFYRGEFELPYERIKKMFAEGYESDAWGKREKTTFSEIVAGMAPGGAVAVWVGGLDRQYEVFFGYAQPVELDWHTVNQMPRRLDRKMIVERELDTGERGDPLVAVYRKHVPFGLWESYRKRYTWWPVFEGVKSPRRVDRMRYYNGEREVLEFPLEETVRTAPRAAPKYMITRFPLDIGEERSLEVNFDEQTTRAAYEQMGATGKPFELVFDLQQVGTTARPTLYVRNADLKIQLKAKCDVRLLP